MTLDDRTLDTTTSSPGKRGGRRRPKPWQLAVVHGPDGVGRRIPVDGELTVGRRGADLVLRDTQLSRQHFKVSVDRDEAVLRDLDSRNGTHLDGAPLPGEAALEEGSIIRAGASVFVVERGLVTEVEPDEVLIGGSPGHLEVLRAVRTLASADLPVLLEGETGTGKELVAARLHALSGRTGSYVAVNCAAVPEALMESTLFGHKRGAFTGATEDAPGFFGTARGGTLLLDEVGEMATQLQPKLLRVLESGEYNPVGSTEQRHADVRVIAATNRDLAQEVEAGRFRMDLYARLSGFVVKLPALRQRRADIPRLLHHFRRTLAPQWTPSLDAAFVEGLLLYDWPMNVRELRNTLQRLALTHADAERLTRVDLPKELTERPAVGPTRDDPTGPALPESAEDLETLMRRFEGNVGQIAKYLGKDRTQVYRWIRRWEVDPDAFRDG